MSESTESYENCYSNIVDLLAEIIHDYLTLQSTEDKAILAHNDDFDSTKQH